MMITRRGSKDESSVGCGRAAGRDAHGVESDTSPSGDDLGDRLCAGADAARVVATPERRPHEPVADLTDFAVGQYSLHPVAGQDEHLAVLDRDQEDDTVVFAARSRFPRLGDLHRVVEGRERLPSS